MAKNITLLSVIMIISSVSFSQTTKPKLDEVKNDPKTTQNAAKADVQVANNKNVLNSATLKAMMIKRKEQRLRQRKYSQRRTS
jgi:hypothetical protein